MILMGWSLLIFGFIKRDYTITVLSSVLLIVLGLDLLIYDYGLSKLLGNTLGLVHLFIGFYIFLRGNIEIYKDRKWKKPKLSRRKKKEEQNQDKKVVPTKSNNDKVV